MTLKAPDNVIEERRSICEGCPYNIKAALGRACSACGCYIKPKTMLALTKCPKNKWLRHIVPMTAQFAAYLDIEEEKRKKKKQELLNKIGDKK